MPSTRRPWHILPTVVVAQFAGTSVWFATNAVVADLERDLGLSGTTAWLTGAVQLGFIAGTAGLSITGLADRFSARWMFAFACVLAALANLSTLAGTGLGSLFAARLATGVALAGVYPIGMKLTAGWYRDGLGAALGWLVGALVLGTAFPHLVRGLAADLPWQAVVWTTSGLALFGGAVVAIGVADGPHLRAASPVRLSAIPELWGNPRYRAASIGYFGHMWELYTFWAMVPAWLVSVTELDPALASFAVVASGVVGCVGGGLLSSRSSSASVARLCLGISAVCCLVAPFLWEAPDAVVLGGLVLWGVAVVGDSPQLSALSAVAAPRELVGTGLALATAVGFGLTVVSLQLAAVVPLAFVPWLLLPGPVFGAWALRARTLG